MDSLTHPLMFLSNREAWREAGRGRHCDKEFHKEDTVSISSLSEPTLFVFPSVCLHTMDTEGFNFPHFTDRKCLNEYVLLLKSDFFFLWVTYLTNPGELFVRPLDLILSSVKTENDLLQLSAKIHVSRVLIFHTVKCKI